MSESENRTVLVVDDDPGIRIAVSMKLKMAGFTIDQATDGQEAYEHLQEHHADLMVVDVGMPRMDGYTLCQKLQSEERTRSLPVVILTAQDMDIPPEVVDSIGRHRFMMKPFSPRELVRVVNELLDEGDGGEA